jgi:hypothetical protein
MKESLHTYRYLAAAGVILLLLAAGSAYLEYRTNAVARILGAYLADNNASRSSTGRLWDLITSETEARRSLPDSLLERTIPTNIPTLVQTRRLSIERIPEEGLPGYFAILTQTVPTSEREIVDAGRLVDGVRIHRIGRTILEAAQLDPAPFLLEARLRAEAMGKEVEALEQADDHPSLAVQTDSLAADTAGAVAGLAGLQADTAGAQADTAEVQADMIGVQPPDSIAASIVKTFASVILEEKLTAQKRLILADWNNGSIAQIFVNRGLGDYQCELYYLDSDHPSVNFTILADRLSAALGLPNEEDPK